MPSDPLGHGRVGISAFRESQGDGLPQYEGKGKQRQDEDARPDNTAKLDAKNLLGQEAGQEQRRTGHCDSGAEQEGTHLPAPDGQKR